MVEELSFDHDLGDDERCAGYEVNLWIEEAVRVAFLYTAKDYGAFSKSAGIGKNAGSDSPDIALAAETR